MFYNDVFFIIIICKYFLNRMWVLAKEFTKPLGEIETNLNGYTVSKFQTKRISVKSKYLYVINMA